MNPEIQLITQPDELANICQFFIERTQEISQPFVALDTEFIRTDSYFPKLSLIQIGIKQTTALIDYIALQKHGLFPFLKILKDPHIVKVFHAARQDCEVLLYALKNLPSPIFDTQIASAFLGFGLSISYEKLIAQTLEIHLNKECQRSQWLHRPLTNQQIRYAANDVNYLIDAYPKLIQQLQQSKRLEWVISENLALLDKDIYEVDASTYWKKFPFTASQWKAAFIMKYLTAWREEIAIILDKPRFHIINDQILFNLCFKKKLFETELIFLLKNVIKPRLSFPFDLWHQHHLFESFTNLLKQVNIILTSSPVEIKRAIQTDMNQLTHRRDSSRIHLLKTSLRKICQQCAQKNNLEDILFANKQDLDLFVQGIEKKQDPLFTASRLSKGWRKELLQDFQAEIQQIIADYNNDSFNVKR